MKTFLVLTLVLLTPIHRSYAETTTVGPLIRLSADKITYSTPMSGIAEGHVLIEIPPDKRDVLMEIIATGGFATFDLAEGEILLQGFPKITRRTYTLRATQSTTTVRFNLAGVMRIQGPIDLQLPQRERIFPIPKPEPPRILLPKMLPKLFASFPLTPKIQPL